MSAAADRLSDPKIRARVQELEQREDLGPFLYAAADSVQEVPPQSSYRYTFTRRTLTYRELGVIR